MNRERSCCLVFFAFLFWAGAVSGATWDLYKDMSFTANPNGAWSYGYGALLPNKNISTVPDTSALVLFNKVLDQSNSFPPDVNANIPDVNISVKRWCYNFDPAAEDVAIIKHTTENDGHPRGTNLESPAFPNWWGIKPGQCGLSPGLPNRNYPVVARWTSPIAGVVRVHGTFGECLWFYLKPGRWIKHNDTVKFKQAYNHNETPFDFEVTVAVGDKIEFIGTQGSFAPWGGMAGYCPMALVARIDSGCDRQGVYLTGDLNQDCYINFADFAISAQGWLTCNNPQDSKCITP
jgi:hypothetical protein